MSRINPRAGSNIEPGARVVVHPAPDRRTGRTYDPWKGTVRKVWPGALWIEKDHDPVPAFQGRALYNAHPAHVEALP